MFGKIGSRFGSKASAAPKAGTQLAMPLFAGTDPVSADAIVAAWAEIFPDRPPLRAIGADTENGGAQFEVGGRTLMVMHMPVPVPNDEALHAVRSSWMWQEPDTAVRGHRSHAIVAAMGSEDAVGRAWDVARLSTAVLKAGSPAALYWGNGRQVHSLSVLEKFMLKAESPPLPLWVGITISGDSRQGPFSAATHGLESLGHKEFEIRGTRMGIGDIRVTLLDLALYVLRQGPVLLHGQTFGRSADERWTIRHEKSRLVPGRDAIVLGIP